MEKAASKDQKSGEREFLVRAPEVSMPKGGGAIRGIGEKFASNPVTGTGSMSVPIATSPGRSGFGPQLSLSYDSGAGNGPFGLGWSLSLPSITRKTDKGLPRYCDAEGPEVHDSDTFLLSGAEDLVPVLRKDAAGRLVIDEDEVDGWRVRRYRPRIEGLFARIERWSKVGAPREVHWRSISKDNVLTLYGLEPESRIADPLDAEHIFSWLICETRDDKGNAVLYRYKAEDGLNVDLGKAHERNRKAQDDPARKANRYLKRIHYGNRTPLLNPLGQRPRFLNAAQVDVEISRGEWMFEVVFDYGEHVTAAPGPDDDRATDAAGLLEHPWKPRPDPFSSYRSGFEVRTARLCRRVLMFHHFADEADVGRSCLVRSTDFAYPGEADPGEVARSVYSFLRAVTHSGYRRSGAGYEKAALPALEFEYSEAVVNDEVGEVDAESLENLPGAEGAGWQWADLHGEGISGLLTEAAGAWFYKRNISPIAERPVDFGPMERIAAKPNLGLAGPAQFTAQFMDLAGDGQPGLVVIDGPFPGLYEHDDAESWQAFRPFTSRLARDLSDPNVKLVDVDGDGRADVFITEDDSFVWHASLAEEGFGPAQRVAKTLDEENGPRVVFADGTQSVYLADLSGDGLSDLVRIRNGEICYWPNLGYGRFGAKVTMDNAPLFDRPDQFDHRRIRLADIDGSGTTDIIYLRGDGVQLYFNQAGNGWSLPQRLDIFPRVDDVVSIVPTDLFGNGTACLVWSSPLPGDSGRQMRYVDLMGGRKPHLLVKSVNNLGAETRVTYASSIEFYLRDKRDGKPWITRLPFPAHVVTGVETWDHVSRNRFATRYAYHHGYFDGEEREFRGFGMVEQWDSEHVAALVESSFLPAENLAAESHVPPVHTRTWFHTGVYLARGHVSDFFSGLLDADDRGEYFREPGLNDDEARTLLLPDTDIPAGLTLEEEREACRALKGAMLRQEVYGLDGSAREPFPYTVTEQNFAIRLVQPRADNRHAVFFTHPLEAITFHYERNPADPRVQHVVNLEVDGFGNVTESAQVGYGRRRDAADSELAPEDVEKQRLVHITCTRNAFTNAIERERHEYRTPVPAETRTWELRKPEQERSRDGLTELFGFETLQDAVAQAGDGVHDVEYQDIAFAKARAAAVNSPAEGDKYFRRLVEHARTIYRSDDLTRLLPLGQIELRALAGESYKLAFTEALLEDVFQRPRAGQPAEALIPGPSVVLAGQGGDRGGYVQSADLEADGRFPVSDPDDRWWMPSGRSFFKEDSTGGAAAELAEACAHFFLPRRFRDPFEAESTLAYDGPANAVAPRYDLFVTATRDALDNETTATHDYRVLQPRSIRDPNGNLTAVAFDTLGMVVGTAVMGKPLPAAAEGDSLTGFDADLTQAQIDRLFDAPDPRTETAALLQDATTRIVYDLDRFRRTRDAQPDKPEEWQACFAATLARETHVNAPLPPHGSRIQVAFSYSDGFGREIQKKIQAEPGALVEGGPAVDPRWVGTGWAVFNNKGKPVRQYEPFFSPTHRFQFGVKVGVSPVLFYDPAERVIATLHPNHTFEKVVFDPWQQTTWDVNDTCASGPAPAGGNQPAQTGDPRTDPDIAGYVARHFEALPVDPGHPWQTWREQRIGGALGADEQAAAERAEGHAGTPTAAHFDALGRPFVTFARNRVVCKDHPLDGTEASFAARVELDIEGNEREVRDAVTQPGDPLGRIVMRYDYDMLGNRIRQISMEAGARWMLNDVAGKPIRAWDSRGHKFTTVYDALRRPVEQTVRGASPDSDPGTLNIDVVVDRIEYGEAVANAQALNLRTRVFRHFDSAGVATNARLDLNDKPVEAYDFKGNLLRSTRRLVTDYKATADWSSNPKLDGETFEAATRYDALNRPIQSIAPHSSLAGVKRKVIQPVFNEASLLERVDVWLERASDPAGLLDPNVDAPSPVGVAGIDYDAKGQRRRIDYENGASTLYRYDPLTLRLVHLYSRRGAAFTEDCVNPAPPPPTIAAPDVPPQGVFCGLQNLHYTYDPAGNITHIRDDAQQTIYFNNRRVEPSNDYVYDAIYRLIQAQGREHLGQGGAPIAHSHDDSGRDGIESSAAGRFAPGDGNAMGSYVERYVYDAVGNFTEMQHRRTDARAPGWTRSYAYSEASLIENGGDGGPLKTSNRLSRTSVNVEGDNPIAERYEHDAHGNIVRMPHLGGGAPGPNLHLDYKDQLHRTDLGGGGAAYYVYDASGQRVRKVWEKAAGLIEERIYLGGAEIFRKHEGAPAGPIDAGTATLERETLHVMDDRQRIALVETRTLDTRGNDRAPPQLIRYQFGNHLGSATLELDDQAQIVSYEEYAPYGSTTHQAVRSSNETPKRYRYTGKERDEESGLHYHGARYYAAWLGRWVSCDPAGISESPHLYGYVGGRPLVRTDSSGLAWDDPLRELFEAVDSNLNAEARKEAVQKPKESVHIPLAIAKEAVTSGQDLVTKGPVRVAIEAGKTWQNEFVAAVVTPNANEAAAHSVKAVGAAVRFTAASILAYEAAKKKLNPVPVTQMAPEPPTSPDSTAPATQAASPDAPSAPKSPETPEPPEPVGGAPKPNVDTNPGNDEPPPSTEEPERPKQNRGIDKSESMEERVRREVKNRPPTSAKDPNSDSPRRGEQNRIHDRGKDKQDVRNELNDYKRRGREGD